MRERGYGSGGCGGLQETATREHGGSSDERRTLLHVEGIPDREHRAGQPKYYIAPLFKAAKIQNDGHMMSHRLRDTFAVDLLEKGVPVEEVSKLLGQDRK